MEPITDPAPEESGCSATLGTSAILAPAIAAAFVMLKKKR
jgi:hypothetical protein